MSVQSQCKCWYSCVCTVNILLLHLFLSHCRYDVGTAACYVTHTAACYVTHYCCMLRHTHCCMLRNTHTLLLPQDWRGSPHTGGHVRGEAVHRRDRSQGGRGVQNPQRVQVSLQTTYSLWPASWDSTVAINTSIALDVSCTTASNLSLLYTYNYTCIHLHRSLIGDSVDEEDGAIASVRPTKPYTLSSSGV